MCFSTSLTPEPPTASAALGIASYKRVSTLGIAGTAIYKRVSTCPWLASSKEDKVCKCVGMATHQIPSAGWEQKSDSKAFSEEGGTNILFPFISPALTPYYQAPGSLLSLCHGGKQLGPHQDCLWGKKLYIRWTIKDCERSETSIFALQQSLKKAYPCARIFWRELCLYFPCGLQVYL